MRQSDRRWMGLLPPMLAVIVALVVGAGGGILVDRLVLSPPLPEGARSEFALMAEAWRTIEQRYIFQDNVAPRAMAHSAIDGMVRTLGDPGHTRFLPPDLAVRHREQIGGAFEGIGAYIEMREGRVTIVTPIDGSPAQRAGLEAGDAIVGVNGQDVTGASLSEVSDMVLGPAGTEVTITVLDPDTGNTRQITLQRAEVDLDLVTWDRLPETAVAYVRISAFSDGATDDLAQTLGTIAADELDGLILDLRNNPGGLLSEATGVASHFIEEGAVLERHQGQGEVTIERVEPDIDAVDVPMVVLINGGTASAAEVVTGALMDHDRAVAVGTTTAGAGTVLNPFPLDDGSLLLLAVEEWMTPDGRRIFQVGIAPDETVTLPDGVTPLIQFGQTEITQAALNESGDVQLMRALEILQGGSR